MLELWFSQKLTTWLLLVDITFIVLGYLVGLRAQKKGIAAYIILCALLAVLGIILGAMAGSLLCAAAVLSLGGFAAGLLMRLILKKLER